MGKSKLIIFLTAFMVLLTFTSTACGNNGDDTGGKEIVFPEKHVNFSFWDWQVATPSDARRLASLVKEMGYTGVDFTFRWTSIEYDKDEYYFDYVDDILDEFDKKDLFISTSLMFWSINIPWHEEIEWQKLSDGTIYDFSGRGASPSFSHAPTVEKMLNAFKAFATHINTRYEGRVTRIHARTSQYGELEYFCGSGMLDYGQPAMDAFVEYLKDGYGTVSALLEKTKVSKSFTSWETLSEAEPQELSELFYFDWQMFRQREALNLSALFDDALEEINPDIPFALQVGSLWDAAAATLRGVFDPYLASKACDILHTDDGPGFPHAFSIDLTSVTGGVEYASEIDGFWHPTIQALVNQGDKSLSPYVTQAREMGRSGIKYLNTANWSLKEMQDYQTPLTSYVSQFLLAEERSPHDASIAILINTVDFIYKARAMDALLLQTYNSLSENGTKKVRFVTDTQLIENPQLLNGIQKLYIGTTYGEYCMREELITTLLASDTQLISNESTAGIAFKNEYRINCDAADVAQLKAKF